jgi:hypothetical protein
MMPAILRQTTSRYQQHAGKKLPMGKENIKVNKVKFFLCVTNRALRHENVWGSGCTDPGILDLGTC